MLLVSWYVSGMLQNDFMMINYQLFGQMCIVDIGPSWHTTAEGR